MSDHPKVIRGKEGYLFLAGDQNAVIKQHSGEILLERARLKRWRNLFIGRKKILDSLSCHYYVQIVPDKHCIYRQYLPDKFKISEIQNVDLFLSYIKPILACPLRTVPAIKLVFNLNWAHKEASHAKKTLQT